MKSAEIITEGVGLFPRMREALLHLGAGATRASDDVVNYFATDGRLYNLFDTGYFDPWDPLDEGVLTVADDLVRIPDLRTVDHVAVECRWLDLFADVTCRVAEILGETVWVIDNRDVLWDAARIDPDRFAL